MSASSFWAGYRRETARRYRKGRDVITFSEDWLHALVDSPGGQHHVTGEGAAILRQMIEEDEEHDDNGADGRADDGPDWPGYQLPAAG